MYRNWKYIASFLCEDDPEMILELLTITVRFPGVHNIYQSE